MKIRKVFESEDYYTVSSWNIAKNRPLEKRNLITDFETKVLLNEFPQLSVEYDTSSHPRKLVYKDKLLVLISIDDEWYFLRVYTNKFDKYRRFLGESITYKCDQLDGVIECIKNEVIDKY